MTWASIILGALMLLAIVTKNKPLALISFNAVLLYCMYFHALDCMFYLMGVTFIFWKIWDGSGNIWIGLFFLIVALFGLDWNDGNINTKELIMYIIEDIELI